MRKRSIALAALAVFAMPALAASGTGVARFTLGPESIAWRYPAEYCLPAGDDAATAKLVAAADEVNTTHLHLDRCNSRNHYVILKSPNGAPDTAMTRPAFLETMAAQFKTMKLGVDNPSPKALDDAIASRFGAMIGTDVDLKSNAGWISRDDLCAYLGGIGRYSAGSMTSNVAFGGCMTTVRRRIITVYVFDKASDTAAMAALLHEARKLAADIIAQNEKPPVKGGRRR